LCFSSLKKYVGGRGALPPVDRSALRGKISLLALTTHQPARVEADGRAA
jgi:hypothetical protein